MRSKLLKTLGLLIKASARKKVYAHKARKEGRLEVSHLMRVMAESESVQARRLLNSIRGRLDMSEGYISTVFEKELVETTERLSEDLERAEEQGDKPLVQALSQMRSAEIRNQAFYSRDIGDVNIVADQKYYVCQFCGYVGAGDLPQNCPVCMANSPAFREIE
jgi:rubrerythrin